MCVEVHGDPQATFLPWLASMEFQEIAQSHGRIFRDDAVAQQDSVSFLPQPSATVPTALRVIRKHKTPSMSND
jgi:hypothetical protein